MEREFSFSSGFRKIEHTLQEDGTQQMPQRGYRALVLMLVATVLMTMHISRLVQLQLIEGKQHRERADNNRTRLVPVPSNRGHILDRKGKPLAANRLTRSVYLWPKEQSPQQWKITASKLSSVLQIPVSDILDKLEQAGYQSYRPIRLSQSLTAPVFTMLGEQGTEFPGVEMRAESSRYYPNGNVGSHVIGYIGEATADDLKEHPEYPMGMIVGQMGIEASANPQIAGEWGNRFIEVNAKNQEGGILGEKAAKGGSNVQLTLDLEMQKAAEKALGNRRGGVVAMNVKTGAVLVLASYPNFDPNIFTRKVTKKEWDRLQAEDKPFLNRALQGYPPGSTFKIVTSVAGIESGKFSADSIVGTSAFITVGGIQFNEHGTGYGYIGFRDALAFSSNTFYYQVGMATGPEEIASWGSKLGIGEITSLKILGLLGGSHGTLPNPELKEKVYGEPWYAGDTVTMSIGQGLVLVTPLEGAVMVSAIANGGYRVKPHLLAAQTNTSLTKPEPTGIKPETLAVIREGLIAVVKEGTGSILNDGSIPLTGGKTGTSEVLGQPSHSWYVAFGPAEKPEIAIAVVVENGGFGAVSAAPIAKEIFKTYFAEQAKTSR
ncbi:penicillin-binding protein 2 [Oscillatoriales cyanobacterium USR001]|nr:penicillin-binding protein 2 [Oscillatoriales cyanobacterium USR001]